MPKRKHPVLKEFAPFFAALVLAGLLFLFPLNRFIKFSKSELDKFAQAPSIHSVFIGYNIKEQAFKQSNYLPVLGSSELEKVDPFHPSVFSQKYKTSYTPFLAGQPGTQSLPLYFYMNSVQSEMKNRKIVFIISPQWFTQKGLIDAFASNFISKGEIYNWIQTSNPKNVSTRILAQRLINLKLNQGDILLNGCLEKMAKGQAIGSADMTAVKIANFFWQRQDSAFSNVSDLLTKQQNQAGANANLTRQLPDQLNYNKLYQLAARSAERSSTNNPFHIRNSTYRTMSKGGIEKRKNGQIKTSYLQSPEYADFQLVLNQFAANHDQVLFIIQPVNGAWYKYTGLSMSMLKQFSSKMTQQLKSQGFNQIDDMTDLYDQPYYVGDTIHLGDKGWVTVDQHIQNFMSNKVPKTANYQINNDKYLSTDWKQFVPSK